MTTGSLLYLIMCLVAFGAFSAVLAHFSRQQSRLDRVIASKPAQTAEPQRAMPA
jgi:hypothetical protein